MMDVIFSEQNKADDVVRHLEGLAESGGYVFRGYGKQDELLPNIIRTNTKYARSEKELLYAFEKYGSHYFKATSTIDFLSYAQHFGLPTRLLDFTHNPFIALSFALYKNKSTNYSEKEDKDFYYIRYAKLEDNIVLNTIPLEETLFFSTMRTELHADKACAALDRVDAIMNHRFSPNQESNWAKDIVTHGITSDTEEYMLKKMDKGAIIFVDPSLSNERIIMQQGLFMLPYDLDSTNHLSVINRNTYVLKIHKSLREDLLKYLDVLGFNTFRLMPDLTSICDAVKRKVMGI